jgi:GNAT superfamily N-acetyltransferase
MPIDIRLLQGSELVSAARVLDEAFGATDGHYLPNLKRFFAWQPDGIFVATELDTIVGMGGAFDYRSFASIGLMAVLPSHQGKSIGRALMRHVLLWVAARGIPTSVLDATEAGVPLYRKFGFVDTGTTHTIYRCEGDCLPLTRADHVQNMTVAHLDAVVALDAHIFGALRRHMLSSLLAEFPNAAFVLQPPDGHVRGYLFAGRNLGPFGAQDQHAARLLLSVALKRLVEERRIPSVILPDANRFAVELFDAQGFLPFRSCQFMYHGHAPIWGDISRNYGILSYATG